MSYHQTKPRYGNWIRRRILGRIGLMALLVAMLSLLPLPLVARLILWMAGGILFLVFLSILSVYLLFADHIGNFQTHIRQVLFAQLPWDGNGKALDIGTGNGALAIGLARQYPQALVEGVDLWGVQWEYAQSDCEHNARLEQVEERVHFRQASAARLPYLDETFDAAVSHFVFHEVDHPDKRQVLAEALRVVRPGGVFAFQDMFLDTTRYGPIPDLLETLRSWGIQEVECIPTRDLLRIPLLVRNRRALGCAGNLFGRK